MRTLRTVAASVWLPILIVAIWWTWSADSTSLFYPPLSKTWSAFKDAWTFELFGSDFVPSVAHLVAGLAVAWTIGVGVGVVLGQFRMLEIATRPLLGFIRSIPPVALIPLGLLIFGIGTDYRIFIIVLGTVWPVLIGAIDGVRGAPPLHADVSTAFRIAWHRRMLRITIPAAAPSIAAGMRTSIGIGVILMVVSELVGSSNGVGFQLLQASNSFRIDHVWAAIIVLGLLGYVLNTLFGVAERRVLRWYHQPSER